MTVKEIVKNGKQIKSEEGSSYALVTADMLKEFVEENDGFGRKVRVIGVEKARESGERLLAMMVDEKTNYELNVTESCFAAMVMGG